MSDQPEDLSNATPADIVEQPTVNMSSTTDKSDKVGKNHPPKEHRFKPGNKQGGRKPGSKNRDNNANFLDTKVVVERDSLNRPIWMTWRGVINKKLMQKIAEGDLSAMRLALEYDYKMATLNRNAGPAALTEQQMRQRIKDENDKAIISKKLTDSLVKLLGFIAKIKKLGLFTTDNGGVELSMKGRAVYRYLLQHDTMDGYAERED